MGDAASSANCLHDDVERRAGLRLLAADFFPGALHGSQNIGAAIDPVERGGKRDNLALPIVPGNGAHDLAKLFADSRETQARPPRETG